MLELKKAGQREVFPEGATRAYSVAELLGEVQAPNMNDQHIEALATQIAAKMEAAKGSQVAEKFSSAFSWEVSQGVVDVDLVRLGKAVGGWLKRKRKNGT